MLFVGVVSAEETEASVEPAIEQVGDVEVGLIGQQEQRPGNATKRKRKIKFLLLKCCLRGTKKVVFLPFRLGNKGGANCELSEAKCGGKNSGGFVAVVAAAVLGVVGPLSSIGRKWMLDATEEEEEVAATEAVVVEWLQNDSN